MATANPRITPAQLRLLRECASFRVDFDWAEVLNTNLGNGPVSLAWHRLERSRRALYEKGLVTTPPTEDSGEITAAGRAVLEAANGQA
jgi:hypothetical protein